MDLVTGPSPALPSRLSPEDAAELRRLVSELTRADRQDAAVAANPAVHTDDLVSALADQWMEAYKALWSFVGDLRGQWYRDVDTADTADTADTGSAEVGDVSDGSGTAPTQRCEFCGRVGTRAFRTLPGFPEEGVPPSVECTGRTACMRRVVRLTPPEMRAAHRHAVRLMYT